jgi:pyruvate,water dikinase
MATLQSIYGPEQTFAVRSSGVAEDSVESSYAGIFESYLEVSIHDIETRIANCAKSGDTARSAAYSGVTHAAETVAVLLQPMVRPDLSGVTFSANPVTGDQQEIVVECMPGSCEPIVSGSVTPACAWFKKANLNLIRTEGLSELTNFGSSWLHWVRQSALVATRIEERCRHPVDLEWGVSKDHLWCFQFRAITT